MIGYPPARCPQPSPPRAAACRSAARDFSKPDWKIQDPQLPKSRWFHTDALFVGFRVVRPLKAYDIKLPPTEPNKER